MTTPPSPADTAKDIEADVKLIQRVDWVRDYAIRLERVLHDLEIVRAMTPDCLPVHIKGSLNDSVTAIKAARVGVAAYMREWGGHAAFARMKALARADGIEWDRHTQDQMDSILRDLASIVADPNAPVSERESYARWTVQR